MKHNLMGKKSATKWNQIATTIKNTL